MTLASGLADPLAAGEPRRPEPAGGARRRPRRPAGRPVPEWVAGPGGFDPPSSDIDVLAATAAGLDEPAVARLADLHATLRAADSWMGRLEVVCLPLATLRRHDPNDQCSYPIAASGRVLALGRQGPSWVLDRWVVGEHGLVVAGPHPSSLIDPIGPQVLQAAVRELLLSFWAGQLQGRPRPGCGPAATRRSRSSACAGPVTVWSRAWWFPSRRRLPGRAGGWAALAGARRACLES
jgi:hypothetical protein